MHISERWSDRADPEATLTGMPVVSGLNIFISETAVAEYAGVSQTTVNRWANGTRGAEAGQIIFLTGLLRMFIATAGEGLDLPHFSDQQKMVMRAKIRAAQVWLATQEEANQQLPPEAMQEALALNDARMAALAGSQPAARIRRPKARKNETRTPHELGGIEGAGSANMTTTPRKGGRRVRA